MRINLEEAFQLLKEDTELEVDDALNNDEEVEIIDDKADPAAKNEDEEAAEKLKKIIQKAKKDSSLGKNIRKISSKIIEDFWDQVYCTLTDSYDERVRNLLGQWSGHRHYPVSHVMPSATAKDFLPKGFKNKPGYNDIIVFSPQLDLHVDFLDDAEPNEEDIAAEQRRNKKNRKLDFAWAKDVANVYNLPYEELEDAVVVYVPKTPYLKADTLDDSKAMTLFPEELIEEYLNNTNQRIFDDGKGRFTYDLKHYYKQQFKDWQKNKKIKFFDENEDLKNWVDDTTDEIFHDTFGVKSADNDFTAKEQKIYDMLRDKVLNVAIVTADNAIKGHKLLKNPPSLESIKQQIRQAKNSQETQQQ